MLDVFHLSNDPTVRYNSFHPNPIEFQTHETWFQRLLSDNESFLYLFRNKQKTLMGQVRLTLIEKQAYQISISLASEFRGKKLSSSFLQHVISIFPKSGTIIAWIKKENQPSIRAFLRAGFVSVGTEIIHKSEAIKMEIQC